MALSIDGSASANFSTTNTKAVALTTTIANDIIVLYVGYAIVASSGAPTISSVTDTAGLAWHRRGGVTGTPDGNASVIDVWWAHSPGILTANNITVTLTGNVDDGILIAFGVSGVPSANYNAPWDTNNSLPVSGLASINGPASLTINGISTNSSSGMILPFIGNPRSTFNATSAGAGYTLITSQQNSGGTNFWSAASDFKNYSAALSGATETPFTFSFTQTLDILYYLDALSGVAASSLTWFPMDVEKQLISEKTAVIGY